MHTNKYASTLEYIHALTSWQNGRNNNNKNDNKRTENYTSSLKHADSVTATPVDRSKGWLISIVLELVGRERR